MLKFLKFTSLRYYLISTTIFLVLMSALSWYQTSKFVFNEYNRICTANPYDGCMAVYLSEYNYYKIILTVSLILLGLSLVFLFITLILNHLD